MYTSIKDLGHNPPHGASSDVCFFLDTICAIIIHSYARMVQRSSGQLLSNIESYVIRSHYTHGICPYRLKPHDAISAFVYFWTQYVTYHKYIPIWYNYEKHYVCLQNAI